LPEGIKIEKKRREREGKEMYYRVARQERYPHRPATAIARWCKDQDYTRYPHHIAFRRMER
jgi:hypothetical protein